jgi:hypothetical protein
MNARARWRTLTVFLLLGITLNVLVALTIAINPSQTSLSLRDPRSTESWPLWVPPTWPAWEHLRRTHPASMYSIQHVRGFGIDMVQQVFWPNYEAAGRPAPNPPPVRIVVSCDTVGLPFRSFHVEYGAYDPNFQTRPRVYTRPPGILGGWSIPGIRPFDRPLPLAPLWPGFALNTLFYASALSVPFVLFQSFRRRHRLRRGLCPRCAYDLQGLRSAPCPECGHRVAAH